MASLTHETWVWISSGSWWWTGKPDVMQSMGLQRVRHDWVTELSWTENIVKLQCISLRCRAKRFCCTYVWIKIYIFFFTFSSITGYYNVLNRVPCAILQIPVIYLFYMSLSSYSRSVMSDSVTPWSARLFCPWDSPGKNTGMGCQFLLRSLYMSILNS